MNFLQEIEQFVAKLFHPAAQGTLSSAASYLTTNKATLVAEAAASGQTAEVFLIGTVTGFMGKQASLQALVPFTQPVMQAFLDREVGFGTNDVGVLIDKLAAWLIAERANV